MDRSRTVIIHISEAEHQRLYGSYLSEGFFAAGFTDVFVTHDKTIDEKGAIHVCIGPHYALEECLGKKTIYIDRCLWGDDLEYVTIGWLRPDRGMVYPYNCDDKRPRPELLPWRNPKEVKKVLFLCDYGPYPQAYQWARQLYPSVKLRPHPSARQNSPNIEPLPPLIDEIDSSDLTIGYRTSALFTAATRGCPVVSLDMRSSVWDIAGKDLAEITCPDRIQWINNMSYAQWSAQEICTGEAINYVINNST